jgi:predicted Zn-dependent peptidase
VNGLSREMAVGYLRQQYVPNNTVVAIAGAVPDDEVFDRVGEALGDWQAGEPGTWYPAVNGQKAPRAALKYKTSEQAHVSMAVRGLPHEHPDRYALDLLSVILGEGMSSRLVMELRERRGLCYDVHSYTSHFQDAGSFAVYAGVDPSRAPETVEALIAELARLRDEGVPEDELARAKELAKGRLLLRMEDTRAVSGWLGGQELLLGRVRTVDEVVGSIDGVTSSDVQRVARDVLVGDQLNLAVVGPFRSDKRFLRFLNL